jgi:PIN domain nuclease of toxin-antitoxin system
MKRYLLDTHLVYWWMTADIRLGKATQCIITESEIVVSVASVLEMVLKNTRGKLPLPQGSITEQLESQGFNVLPILPRHVEAMRNLHCVHNDPFDLLLIAQSQDERIALLTRDSTILGLELDGVMEG